MANVCCLASMVYVLLSYYIVFDIELSFFVYVVLLVYTGWELGALPARGATRPAGRHFLIKVFLVEVGVDRARARHLLVLLLYC